MTPTVQGYLSTSHEGHPVYVTAGHDVTFFPDGSVRVEIISYTEGVRFDPRFRENQTHWFDEMLGLWRASSSTVWMGDYNDWHVEDVVRAARAALADPATPARSVPVRPDY